MIFNKNMIFDSTKISTFIYQSILQKRKIIYEIHIKTCIFSQKKKKSFEFHLYERSNP